MKMGCGAAMLTAAASAPDEGRCVRLVPQARLRVWSGQRHEPETVAPASAGSTQSRLSERRCPPRERSVRRTIMDTPYPRCAGSDVHTGNVVVCVRCCDRPGKVFEE